MKITLETLKTLWDIKPQCTGKAAQSARFFRVMLDDKRVPFAFPARAALAWLRSTKATHLTLVQEEVIGQSGRSMIALKVFREHVPALEPWNVREPTDVVIRDHTVPITHLT